METTTKEFADWWSTCGFTCEGDEGLANHAFHAGMQEGNKNEAQAFNEGYYKGVNECETAINRDLLRHKIAAMAIQGMLSRSNGTPTTEDMIERSVEYADKLLAALAKQPEVADKKAQEDYLRRNLIHAKTVGVRAGLRVAIARMEKQKQPPLWLLNLLRQEYAKMDAICAEAVMHRDQREQFGRNRRIFWKKQ